MAEYLRIIKDLINDSLTKDEYNDLICYDFDSVKQQFTNGMTKSQQDQILLEYVDKHEEIDKLLKLIHQKNCNKFQKYIPELLDADNSQIQDYLSTISDSELVQLLDPYFEHFKKDLFYASQLSLPRQIDIGITPRNAQEIIDYLRLPTIENNYNCIEKFVMFSYLIKKNSESEERNLWLKLKQDLKVWIEIYIKNYKSLCEQIKSKLEDIKLNCNPCLMLAVSEEKSSSNRYFAEAWLIKDINNYTCSQYSDCQPLKIQEKLRFYLENNLKQKDNICHELEALLRDLINTYYIDDDQEKNCLEEIHVFLPYKLINYAIDCWRINEDEEDTIGEDFKVVIRCSERLRGKTHEIIKWRKKKGKQINCQLGKLAINVFDLAAHDKIKSFEKQFKKDDTIAVKISKVFNKNYQPGELLWKGSIPLALWVRQEIENMDNESELNKILSNDHLKDESEKNQLVKLSDIRERVKSTRLDAIDQDTPETHIGRNLCLLWDDPNLLPPKQLLTETNL